MKALRIWQLFALYSATSPPVTLNLYYPILNFLLKQIKSATKDDEITLPHKKYTFMKILKQRKGACRIFSPSIIEIKSILELN